MKIRIEAKPREGGPAVSTYVQAESAPAAIAEFLHANPDMQVLRYNIEPEPVSEIKPVPVDESEREPASRPLHSQTWDPQRPVSEMNAGDFKEAVFRGLVKWTIVLALVQVGIGVVLGLMLGAAMGAE